MMRALLCSGIYLLKSCTVFQGHALYYGRAQLADEYFQQLGYQLPYRVNVADFILDLASADVSAPGRCCPGLLGLGCC